MTMDLRDAAALRLLVLERAADPRLSWHLDHMVRLLSFLAQQGIGLTLAALTVSTVTAAAAQQPASIRTPFRLAIWQWAEFLNREGVLDHNPLSVPTQSEVM